MHLVRGGWVPGAIFALIAGKVACCWHSVQLNPPALAYWPFPTAPAHFWACRSSLNPLREPTQQSDNAARITRVRGVPVRTRGRVQHNPLRAMAEHWLNAARITRVHGFSFWAWQTLLLTPLPMAVPRSPGRAETVLSGAVQHPAGGLQISRTAGSRHAPSGAPRPPLPVACLLCPSKAWPAPGKHRTDACTANFLRGAAVFSWEHWEQTQKTLASY